MKLRNKILKFLAVAALTALLSGCSNPEKSRTTYWYPNWTPDGKIVASKEIEYYKSGAPLSGDTTTKVEDSIVEISADGSNERTIASGVFGWILQVSPSKNYLAASMSGGMWIIDYKTGQQLAVKNFYVDVNSFDWSPDETKVAISRENISGNIEIYNRNFDLLNSLNIGAQLSWKYNDKFVFFKEINDTSQLGFHNVLAFRNPLEIDDVTANFAQSSSPEYIKDTPYVYLQRNAEVRKYNMQTDSYVDLPTDYHGLKKIFFSDDGNYFCGTAETDGGVYISDINGNNLKKIR